MKIPLVMDELHFIPNVHHHFRAYGGWSFALKDYYDMNFTLELDNPITQRMMDIIDPIVYKVRALNGFGSHFPLFSSVAFVSTGSVDDAQVCGQCWWR